MLNAAATAESNGMPADAVCLYGLGSSFIDVLRVINNQLAMVLVPPHPARDEWKALAAEFFEKHLSSGQTYVQAQLMKSSGGEIVGSAFQVKKSYVLRFSLKIITIMNEYVTNNCSSDVSRLFHKFCCSLPFRFCSTLEFSLTIGKLGAGVMH